MKKSNITFGGILIVIGIVALLNNIGLIDYQISIWKFWPLFLLIPGLTFEYHYFSKEGNAGLLVPGGILTTYGLLFMYCSFVSYSVLAYLWPVFIGGVGVGLFQLYYFGKEDRALFYVSMSFIAFAVLTSFLGILNIKGNLVLPIILITIGGIILFSPHKDKSDPIINVEYDDENEKEI